MPRRCAVYTCAFVLVACGFLRQIAAVEYVTIPQDQTGGGYQAFPDITRLKDGRLMTVFYNGYGHVSLPNAQFPNGGRIDYSISTDEGFSWSAPKVLYDGPNDDRDPSITQLNNGRIICNFFSLGNPTEQGEQYAFMGTSIITSDNRGQSWSESRQLYGAYATSSPIRELSNNRLVLPLYWGDPNTAAIGISDDGGDTWGTAIDINNGSQPLNEPDVIQLKDKTGKLTGKFYAAERSDSASMAFSTSTDYGNTWSASQALGFNGHSPYLHRASNGIVLLGYRDYTYNVGNGCTALRYSLDECQTWSSEVVVDGVGGAYPSIVDLKDGSELITYYEEGPGSNIRVKRFLVTSDGIQWLPVTPMPEPGSWILLATGLIGLLCYVWRKRNRLMA